MLDFIVLRVIADLGLAAAAVYGAKRFYEFGLYVSNGSTAFGLCYAFLGALLIMGFINFIRSFFLAISKYGEIYLLTDRKKMTSMQAIKGVTKRFKSVISIGFFNLAIRKAFSSLGRLITSKAEGTLIGETIQPVMNTPLVKIPERFLKHLLSYLDECVLFYAFKHKDVPLCAGVTKALSLFVMNAVELSWQLISARVFVMLLHAVVYLGGFLLLAKHFYFSVYAVVLILVILKCFVLLLDDTVFEPLILSKVLIQFDEALENAERKANTSRAGGTSKQTGEQAVSGNEQTSEGQESNGQTSDVQTSEGQAVHATNNVTELAEKLTELLPELKVLDKYVREVKNGSHKER